MGAAAVALLACGATIAAGQDEGPVGASAKARAAVLTSSQRNALRLGYVRVRVGSASSSRLRLGVRARRAGGGPSFRITKLRKVGLTGPRAKTLRLKLTHSGRRILGSCRALVIDAKGRGGGKRFTAAARSVRRDPRRCSTRLGPGSATPPEDSSAPPGGPPLGALNTENADRCDFLDPSLCLYPFPNDHFTVADATRPTGRRLNISRESTPTSTKSQLNIDPADQNRADGFSPGNLIVTRVPGLDSQAAFQQTGAVPITDMERSFDPDQPVVVINARTKERQLIWAEIDSNPLAHDPPKREDVTLIIRPGKNFEEGERYIVALRRLRAANGSLLKPREEFRAYRDGIATSNPDIEGRRSKFEGIFGTLGDAGIAREDLYLAWDFTVASEESLSGRALAMRDDAFERLGDEDLADLDVAGDAPTFQQNVDVPDTVADVLGDVDIDPIPNPFDFSTIDGRRDFPPCSAGVSAACEEGESDRTARRVTGQIAVPCYLSVGPPACAPGSGFLNGEPSATPTTSLANVICTIPRVAVDGAGTPGQSRPSLYGHGLLGSAGEVGGGNVQAMGQEHNFVFCATDWAGMSTTDIGNVGLLLQDLSTFNTLVDRIQQGYVNFMYLGRWLIHPDGASQNTAFQVGGQPVIDDDELFYDGNSQGGILSGGLTALSPDFQAAVHGVPGMNYSTLLRRSVDFDMYANGDIEGQQFPIGLYQAYPNELERPLVLSLMQLLWDRGESNGFAQHLTNDPLPGSPEHRVLLHPAFGDHQVANVSADVEARTIRACTNRPVLYDGRSTDVEPLFDVPTFGDPACEESGIVYWDGGPLGRIVNGEEHGTPAPPTGNVPPRAGRDPHSYPRNDAKAREQKSDFLKTGGTLTDVCAPLPCFSDGFTGP